ncbi:hypothetical protein GKODMF_03580 [Candidatus Electrothrix gigas]
MPPAIDEFEDLTQFANESFDNDEVDLFEFTDDDDSPLLRLKSIVLSLDWDITEDILAELTDELVHLRSQWNDDKVAQIYLQAMDNIGKYLEKEGAYAHPNAIKLLLNLFYNYEKIVSTPDIGSETITAMLKDDIRKFKVLQLQIDTKGTEGTEKAGGQATERTQEHAQEDAGDAGKAQSSEGIVQENLENLEPNTSNESDTSGSQKDSDDPLINMEATILGLEWEVTPEGLEKFHTEATMLQEHLSNNHDAQILIKGLQALGAYIREQQSNAHPDSFTILHSFYDALKFLIQDTNLSPEQRKKVLIEQITSLNSLKSIIATAAAERAAGKTTEKEKVAPQKTSQKTPKETPQKAQATEVSAAPPQQAADAISDTVSEDADLDSPAVDDDAELELFSDDFEEDDLSPSGGDEDEFTFDEEEELSSEDFSFDEDDALDFGAEDGLDDDLFADEGDEGFSLENDADQEESIVPALTDADEDGGFNEELVSADIDHGKTAELDEKLDSFFDFDDEEEDDEPVVKPVVKEKVAVADADNSPAELQKEGDSELDQLDTSAESDESDVELDSFFDFSDEEDESDATKKEEISSLESWKEELLSADFDEPDGEEEALLEGEEDYDSFFDFDDDETEDEILLDTQPPEKNDEDLDVALDNLDDEQEGEKVIAALADADEEGGFNENEMSSGLADEKAAELDEKLNFFFELDEEATSSDKKSEVPEKEHIVNQVDATEPEATESEVLEFELDEETSELSFDEDDFEGDIAELSLDTDDADSDSATDANVFAADTGAEEEIEGLDDIFNLDDDDKNVPEFGSAGVGGAEDIPALEDEFVVSLDDDDSDKESALSDSGKDTDILSLDDEFSEEEDELDSFFDFDDDDEIATVSDAVPDDDLALSLDDKEGW